MTYTSKFTVTQEMTDAFYSKAEVTSRGTILNLEAAIEAALAAAPEYSDFLQNLRIEVIGDIITFRDMDPEEDESWESWYYAAFDMLSERVRETFARNSINAAAPEQKPSDITAIKAENERLREAITLADRAMATAYTVLAFAFNRLHSSARSRDVELCNTLSKARGDIEKARAALNGGDHE